MEQLSTIQGLIDDLNGQIDTLEGNLLPLIETHMSEQKFASPRDRAQFAIFLAYAINSVVFAYLKSQGEDPTTHPVMKELERVKLYMNKVKTQPSVPSQRTTSVNKDAAERIVRHHLAGNDDNGNEIDANSAAETYLNKMAASVATSGNTVPEKSKKRKSDKEKKKKKAKKSKN